MGVLARYPLSMTLADKLTDAKIKWPLQVSGYSDLSYPVLRWSMTVNRMVAGSSPARGANYFNVLPDKIPSDRNALLRPGMH
jgi:hypothetical protein